MTSLMNCLKSAAAAAALTLATTGSASAATLLTSMDGAIANDGVMFDVTVAGSALTLQSLGINADFGTFDYQVFYRAGGITGAQNDAAAWTSLGRFGALTTAGAGALTTLDIDDVALAAGQTYGFYVTDTQGAFSVFYSASAGAVGDTLASDAALSIHTGYGVTYPFGDLASPRDFNGSLSYEAATAAVPEPASWAMMTLGMGLIGYTLRRRRPVVRFAR